MKRPDLFVDQAEIDAIPRRRLRWGKAYRIIPSKYPPIDLFERIAPKEDWSALAELEMLTNPRLRDEVGTISLVPPSRRVNGPGSTIVMAPFTHASIARPTRFSSGEFGIYYAARKFETSLREVAHHWAKFHRNTNDPPTHTDFRVYVGRIDREMHDLRGPSFERFLHPDDYSPAQALGRQLRDANSNGIVYPSVRHLKGECVAAFWPNVVGIPIQERHIQLKWDGRAISHWFEHGKGEWHAL